MEVLFITWSFDGNTYWCDHTGKVCYDAGKDFTGLAFYDDILRAIDSGKIIVDIETVITRGKIEGWKRGDFE
jgi:hypothetical protein